MPLLRRGPLHAFRALDAFRAEPVKRFRLKKKVKVDTCNSRRWRRGSLATPGTASKPEEKPSQSRRRTKQILPLLDWRQVSLPEDLSSRSYLETFISHIFKHMGSELKSHVAMTCACMVGCNPLGNSGEFRIGTVCSGSEMYMTALPFIVNQLRVACKTLPVTFVHAWACEYDFDKRVWIACNFDVPYIFEDVTTMSHPNGGMEHCTGKLQHPSPVHMIVGGTSCKDASRMSTLHSEMLTAVEDKKGTTGNTYDGLLDLVDVLDPPPDIVVLENVPSLKDKAKKTKGKPAPQYPSNFAAVQATLNSAGFSSQVWCSTVSSATCHSDAAGFTWLLAGPGHGSEKQMEAVSTIMFNGICSGSSGWLKVCQKHLCTNFSLITPTSTLLSSPGLPRIRRASRSIMTSARKRSGMMFICQGGMRFRWKEASKWQHNFLSPLGSRCSPNAREIFWHCFIQHHQTMMTRWSGICLRTGEECRQQLMQIHAAFQMPSHGCSKGAGHLLEWRQCCYKGSLHMV